MKRVNLILLSLLVLISISCGQKSQSHQPIIEIQESVEKLNSQCPIYYDGGNGVTLLNVKYENNTLIYDYKVDRIIDDNTTNMNSFKNSMIYMLKGEAEMLPQSKTFFNNLIETGSKMLYKYHDNAGKSFNLEISNEELKNAFQ